MPSNLGCIGLLAPDGSDLDMAGLDALLTRLLPLSEPLGLAPDGVLLRRWTDPSGARVGLELNARGRVLGVTPSVDGSPGAILTDLRMLNRDATHAAVVDDDGDQLSALALELEERHLVPALPALPAHRSDGPGAPDESRRPSYPASVVALGLEMDGFADDDAYSASRWVRLGDTADQPDSGPGWAPEAFVSFGVWGDPETAEAYARVGGRVLTVSERVNGLTGFRFTVARVSTAGFEVDVCLPPSWPGSVEAGGLLVGNAFLVGSIPELVPRAGSPTDAARPAQPKRRWWGRG